MTGKSMRGHYIETQKKTDSLWGVKKPSGAQRFAMVHIMWECEWDRRVKQHENLSGFLLDLELTPRLEIREALRGGRTEVFRAHVSTEGVLTKCHYLDVTSMVSFKKNIKSEI